MFLKDFCREKYQEWSQSHAFVENCALSHFNEQKGLGDHMGAFFDFDHIGQSIDFTKNLHKAQNAILYGGVILSLFNI